ncbi:MAG: hypothetical protein ACPL4H_08640 [Anaerolineales bacterium]
MLQSQRTLLRNDRDVVIASTAKQSPIQYGDCFSRERSIEKAVSGQLSAIIFLLPVLRFLFFDYYNRSEETVSVHPILSAADVIASAAKQSPIRRGDCFSRKERSFAMTGTLSLRAQRSNLQSNMGIASVAKNAPSQ